jgi:hypothetical protein
MTNLGKCLEDINKPIEDEIIEDEIIDELKIQDEIVETNITNITWTEYIVNLINSYFGFIWIKTPRFFYRNNDNNITELTSELNENKDKDQDFFDKINIIRKYTTKIEKIDELNL